MTERRKKMFVRLMVMALIVAIVSPLAACGRKGAPERQEPSQYPRHYPSEKTSDGKN